MSEFDRYPRSDEAGARRGLPRGVWIALLLVALVAVVVVVVAVLGGHDPTQIDHG
jgi:hypothetical protein